MSKNNISILGSGWLGLPLSDALEQAGHRVYLSTRCHNKEKQLSDQGKNMFQLTVDPNQLQGDFASFLQSDILIVNIPPDRKSNQSDQFRHMLPLIEQSSVEKVIFVSSTSVYRNNNGWVKEDNGDELQSHPLLIEEQRFGKSNKFKTIVVRMAGLIGGKRHPGRFFSNKKISNAEAPVNLIHRADCIQIIQQLLYSPSAEGIYNACSDTHPTKGDFYGTATSSLGFKLPEIEVAQTLDFKKVSNAKIKKELQYRFKHPDLMQLLEDENWY